MDKITKALLRIEEAREIEKRGREGVLLARTEFKPPITVKDGETIEITSVWTIAADGELTIDYK